VVAARENQIKPARVAAAVTAGVEAYRKRMRRYATMPELDIWYDSTHADQLIDYIEEADRGQVRSTSRRSATAAPAGARSPKSTRWRAGVPG
jgi:hypothetical protein